MLVDISTALAGREVLLVLGNCEHVIHAVASLVESILTSSDGAKVLSTSREALRRQGEQVTSLAGSPYSAGRHKIAASAAALDARSNAR